MDVKTESRLREEALALRARIKELEGVEAELRKAQAARRDSDERLRTLFDYAPEAVVMLDVDTGHFIDVNSNAEKLFGLSRRELAEKGPVDVSPPRQPDGRLSSEFAALKIQEALDGGTPVFEWWHCNTKGEQFPCEIRLLRMPWGDRSVIRGSVIEISERKQLELCEWGRTQVLERIARGESLENVLRFLVETIENLLPGMMCSVLVLDQQTNCLRHGAASSLPSFYNEAIDGLKIGPGIGSCGTAAHTGERVVVTDVRSHPYWQAYRPLLDNVDFRACWSEPIVSLDSTVLGTFAMYYRESREPVPREIEIIEIAAQLAAIAIEHNLTKQILQDLNESLEQRVSERTRELAEANQELMRSNDELRQFAYVASHDLQEPLRMVTNFGQLLLRKLEDHLDAEAEEWLGFVIEGGQRMQMLVNDLLNYSQIESQARPFQAVNVGEIVEQTMANLRPTIQDTAAEITFDELPTVVADRPQLLQLLQNLISNAIKFQDQPPPRIHISAEENGEDWVLSVRDNGIGIEAEHTDRIFEFFQRLHDRDYFPGTGIGLPICKRVVQRHSGRIWVESNPEKGNTFLFTLPKSNPVE